MGSIVSLRRLATASKAFARRLLIIGENRFELLKVEMKEDAARF
jgi:hypothetical protein